MTDENWGDLTDIVDDQIEQQGTCALRVRDGMVFTFTKATLARLLEASEKSGRVVVFVKQGATS